MNNRRKQWLERNGGARPKAFSDSPGLVGHIIEVRRDYCGLSIQLQFDQSNGIWQETNDHMQVEVSSEEAHGMVRACHSVLQM